MSFLFVLVMVASAEDLKDFTPSSARAPASNSEFRSIDRKIRTLADSGLVCDIRGSLFAATQADRDNCLARGGRLKPNPRPVGQTAEVKDAPTAIPDGYSRPSQALDRGTEPIRPRNYDPSQPGN